MPSHLIFGYGSLLDPASLKATAPSAADIRPAYILGFTRTFDVWDALGWTETNLDLAGQPFCAVDIHPSTDTQAKVNGVIFTVSDDDVQRLVVREHDYEIIATTAYDFVTNAEIGGCSVFASTTHDGNFDFGSASQLRYLQVCLNGAKLYGEEFYDEFRTTTVIAGKPLSELSD